MRRELAGSLLLLVVVALLVLRPWEGDPEAGPAEVVAEVTRVVDGDTIEARIEGEVEDVRLIGVDTPETIKPGAPVECFGPQASRFAQRALEGRQVRLVFGAERRDRYGRLLAYLYLAKWTLYVPPHVQSPQRERLFNAELIRRGLARTLTIPPNDRFAPRLGRLELGAARAARGLWGACPP
ncbi:MAG: thermonuclease family protein [Solirubrobacterales bacterium]